MAEDSTAPARKKVVNLRLDPELHARLVAFATRTERSANGAAVLAIRTFLDQQDAGVTAAGPWPDELHLR